MKPFEISVDIERPPADVFAYVTDPERLHEWQEGVLEVHVDPPGPLRQGSRMREVRSGPGGRRLEQLVEVAAYEPERVFDLRILEGALLVHGDFRFEPAGGGTRVSMTGHGELTGMKRLLRPLLPRLFSRNFARLKANLERSDAQEAPQREP